MKATSKRAIKKYGIDKCIEAYQMADAGNGARSIGHHFLVHTNAADAMINAGKEILNTTIMKATLKISSSYGFDHNWTLDVETAKKKASFYLGQDVKFCFRVLGMAPADVQQQSGVVDLREEKNRQKLAKWICQQIGLNGQNMHLYECWSFCSQ